MMISLNLKWNYLHIYLQKSHGLLMYPILFLEEKFLIILSPRLNNQIMFPNKLYYSLD